MPKINRNFTKGRMNKMFDERIIPNGEYINALNIRMGSTEGSEMGVLENSKGNVPLTDLQYNGNILQHARCIGAFEDGTNETIYWFIHSSNDTTISPITGKVDMVVSFNTQTSITSYHVISLDDGSSVNTTLNFNPSYLITGVNLIDGLLFWTDNINPPRFINVKRNYPNPSGAGLDYDLLFESLLVIKRPPITSPTINPFKNTTNQDFLEDRFVSFAYRYGYGDREHSATSQFSAPSFFPSIFDYSNETSLNEGMLNNTNSCVINYNTGGPLVTSIDLLFKDMNSSTIKVIESIDKNQMGLADNSQESYVFTNSKIFTILPDSEILRLYDNVPRLAQAQTLMGNRLMYGNYTEGYDLLDINGHSTKLEYTTELISEEIGISYVDTTINTTAYTWGAGGGTVSTDGKFTIDLAGIDLKEGSVITFNIVFQWAEYKGSTPFPNDEQGQTLVSFQYRLIDDYNSVYELSVAPDFVEKIIGVISPPITGTYPSVQDSCTGGNSLNDLFNCAAFNSLSSNANPPLNVIYKFQNGITVANERIFTTSGTALTTIAFKFPAISYVDDLVGTPAATNYAYYDLITVSTTFQEIGDPKSLHSNRGYEVSQIYMDDYNRASTALVSPTNTVHIGCESSIFKNNIRVSIPPEQIAPSWATRYKFAIKPDKKDYDVVYSNFFFIDPTSQAAYFLLEGQNSQKIEEADELIVKRDTQGAILRCAKATVLEKSSQGKDFLDPKPVDSSGSTIAVPAGVYMKLRPNNFSIVVGELPIVAYGEEMMIGFGINNNNGAAVLPYLVSVPDASVPGDFKDYTVPEGSEITIKIEIEREGNCAINFPTGVTKRYYRLDAKYVSSKEYSNFKDWWDGDNIPSTLNGAQSTTETSRCGNNFGSDTTAVYNPALLLTSNNNTTLDVATSDTEVNFQFIEYDSSTKQVYLIIGGVYGYPGSLRNGRSKVTADIKVVRQNGIIIFETNPIDAEPDLWYESDESFAIDTDTGYHVGNEQTQTSSIPAIIDTSFFNCYSFGNGAESYKIQDSIVGKEIVLGNRATSTKEENYQEEQRFSDITYSGVYNEESNINKLNEFNGGLLNFKPLETSFGPIQKMVGRKTDILTLQEDKISYVLAGKNLLSDAAGGSALTSVPEVLGTQVARIEEFGISLNPESFAEWGPDKYFTDAKRGVAIVLSGASSGGDALKVISEQGMETYFRDLFVESITTQVLGGFDPYMKEYVLSSNDIPVPSIEDCISCGTTQVFNVTSSKYITFCVDYGTLVGNVDIDYKIISMDGQVGIASTWDGVGVSTIITTLDPQTGTLSFDKSKVNVESGTIELDIGGAAEIEITYNCPDAESMTVVLVHLTSNNEAGLSTTDQYRWNSGGYNSPTHSESIVFASGTSPVVSLYKTIAGKQGGGVIPTNYANVKMMANKLATDNYDFDSATDTFKYLRSGTLYNNTPTDIAALLAASSTASPIVDPALGITYYSAEFTMPSTGGFLYLLWDYRNGTEVDLCMGATITDACCGCF